MACELHSICARGWRSAQDKTHRHTNVLGRDDRTEKEGHSTGVKILRTHSGQDAHDVAARMEDLDVTGQGSRGWDQHQVLHTTTTWVCVCVCERERQPPIRVYVCVHVWMFVCVGSYAHVCESVCVCVCVCSGLANEEGRAATNSSDWD